MFNIFKQNKQQSVNELEQFRQNFGIRLINENDDLSIRSVLNLNLDEFLLECCKITEFSENAGFFSSNKMKEYLVNETDYITRNVRFHEQISVVSSELAKQYNEIHEDLFNILVTLKEYLNLYYLSN